MKLNIGCGNHVEEGWTGVDLTAKPPHIIGCDIRIRIPADNDSVDVIFTEDMIEHLTRQQCHDFFLRCRAALKPGGRLIVSTPNLTRLAAQYLNGSILHEVKSYNTDVTACGPDMGGAPSGRFVMTHSAEAMNCAFHWWGHQWLYDGPYLIHRLNLAGFTHVREIEPEHPIRRPNNLIVEAFRP